MEKSNISKRHQNIRAWMQTQKVDAVIVTAQDRFVSEYTALAENQRFAVSGFRGSTGDGILVSEALQRTLQWSAPFLLILDGRYHTQGAQETDPSLVTCLNLEASESLEMAILRVTGDLPKGTSIALESARNSLGRLLALEKVCSAKSLQLKSINDDTLSKLCEIPRWSTRSPVTQVPFALSGRSIDQNVMHISRCMKQSSSTDRGVCLTATTDDAAWILNSRGYHLPYLSSVLAYTAVVDSKLLVHFPTESEHCEFFPPSFSTEIIVTRGDLAHFETELNKLGSIQKVYLRKNATNGYLYDLAKSIWPAATVDTQFTALADARASKTPEEQLVFRDSYMRSSRAIAATMRWAKQASKTQSPPTELDVAHKIEEHYRAEGALALSFNTISAYGENSALPHYGKQSDEIRLKPGNLFLLDSGAYYDGGMATDCTRVILCGDGPAQPWQKQIYTLVVKSWIVGLAGKIPNGTIGRDWDAKVRAPIHAAGYDYNHGTGHGIGIHVHEEGISIRRDSAYRYPAGRVVSIEPGIYLVGQGGVRIENVAITQEAPDNPDETIFENLIWVGLDWDCIDLSMLSEAEQKFLRDYELRCATLGTTVTACPLLQKP